MTNMVENFLARFTVWTDSSWTSPKPVEVSDWFSALTSRTPALVGSSINRMSTVAKLFLVAFHMRRLRVQPQIVWVIVERILVNMMNYLMLAKDSPKFATKNHSCSSRGLSIDIDIPTPTVNPSGRIWWFLFNRFATLPAPIVLVTHFPSDYSTETISYLARFHGWNGTALVYRGQ